jgi:hypothetical protein
MIMRREPTPLNRDRIDCHSETTPANSSDCRLALARFTAAPADARLLQRRAGQGMPSD